MGEEKEGKEWVKKKKGRMEWKKGKYRDGKQGKERMEGKERKYV